MIMTNELNLEPNNIIRSLNIELMKLYLCQLDETSNNMIHLWTKRTESPSKFSKFILSVLLHDSRCDIQYLLHRIIKRGYYDEVIKYFDLNQLNISSNNNYILRQALLIHKSYKHQKRIEKQLMKLHNEWYYCYHKYPTPFIHNLLKHKAVLEKVPEGLLDYLIVTDSKSDIKKVKELLMISNFKYKKFSIFEYILETLNKDLIELMLNNRSFNPILHYCIEKGYYLTTLNHYPIDLEEIKNFFILTGDQIDKMKTILSNPNSNLSVGRKKIIENIILTNDDDLIDLLFDHRAVLPTILHLIKHPHLIRSSVREKFHELTIYWQSIID